jgi:hypothetical protein
MWTDNPPPSEARQRNQMILAQKALTPAERFKLSDQGKPYTVVVQDVGTGKLRTDTLNLNQYLAYIAKHRTTRWQAVGVDPMTPPEVSSGG